MESEDQAISSSETKARDEQQGASQVTRSYDCSFCKRGFSNAQALGGHMNIHRKDKAKLKQSSKQAHRHHDQPSLDDHSKVEDRTSSCCPSWNMEDSSSNDESSELRPKQLPLFAETPCGETQQPEELGHIIRDGGIDEEIKSPSSDLDLELRLGPDPPSPTIATRKFF